ncbi:type II and III secretion system protein family protein [Desulfohalovibrio reitneri]|uniref:type II and III secretion system protein family protein n=1 Tax=Desulfohalovibrio reitneri TaxID=1307759 RepID=UPI0004A7638D|nr:type II and III secretion system protein family protein [Desulfohalovibrio reitneri]
MLRAILLSLFLLLLPQEAQAAPSPEIDPVRLEMSVGKSRIVRTEAKVSRISLASPEHADIILLSPTQVYIRAKQAGSTNLTLWNDNERLSGVFDLVITPDVAPLKEMLHRVLPEEPRIKVLTANDSVTLSGPVSSSTNLAAAMSLAEAYAPDKVINLMHVGGVHQVMLEVRVAEMSRSLARRLGVNLSYVFEGQLLQGQLGYTFLKKLTGFDKEGRFILADNVNSALTLKQGDVYYSAFIDALKENGLVKILAEPNLVCLSGEEADFLAGGEIPVPVPQGLGTVGIEYKSFGVSLSFKPTVLSQERLSIQVEPEVSELDFTNAIDMSGVTVPAISTRRASTRVELKSGQTFAIAGLIRDNLREAAARFPVLGDVPVLGSLFRSSEFQKDQTELVILVTPHLAKPLDKRAEKLPTDGLNEPNDLEFYMLGMLEGAEKSPDAGRAPAPPSGGKRTGFDGDFGQILPGEEQ